MTYEQAKICLPPKARFHSSSAEGELYLVGKVQWWVMPDGDGGWDCCKKG
jgi:hypothetical protein